MNSDLFGNEISLKSRDVIDNWNKMQMGFLAHSAATPDHLAKVLQAVPQFALGHAIKGLFLLMLSRREMIAVSQDAYETACQAARKTPLLPRERAYVDALGLWLNGQPFSARSRIEDILSKTPGDALAAKISHGIGFMLGDLSGMRSSIENVLPFYDETHAAFGYMLGCHAFVLEESGHYAKAEMAGRRGLALAKNDAWGLHAVAHVYDMTANARQGLVWLDGKEKSWEHCNNFRYHVWWHKALMLLDQGRTDEVFQLYDTKIRQDKTDDYRDISNATSLLSRLELEGHNVGVRWEELADLSENRTADGCLVFADLHYLLALTGCGRKAGVGDMLSRMYKDAAKRDNEVVQITADPGLAAATGLEALGDGDYAKAFKNLAQARCKMQSIGGSHAQRDVFERLTIDSGLRAGFLDEVELILQDRKARRGGTEDKYAAVRFDMIDKSRQPPEQIQLLAGE